VGGRPYRNASWGRRLGIILRLNVPRHRRHVADQGFGMFFAALCVGRSRGEWQTSSPSP
jgi:hypothetical protein